MDNPEEEVEKTFKFIFNHELEGDVSVNKSFTDEQLEEYITNLNTRIINFIENHLDLTIN